MILGDGEWSVRRLASRSGIPETSCRRLIAELETAQVMLTEWSLDRAIMGVKVYRDGHTKEAVALLGRQPHIGVTCWLVSGADGTAEVFSTLLQATAFIEQHPYGTFHLSPVGSMGLEAAAA